MPKKQLIFIDDSGDPGFKGPASSSAFVMAGAVIMDPEVATKINQDITELRKKLGWPDHLEFKFNKSSKKVRLEFLRTISKHDFSIYGIYIRKTNYRAFFHFSNNQKLYNWAMAELLMTMPLQNAQIKVDGKYGKKYSLKFSTSLRRKVNIGKKRILKLTIQDSRRDNLIQLADFIAGTINRSFQNDKTDSKEYIRIIENKIIELRELDLNNP